MDGRWRDGSTGRWQSCGGFSCHECSYHTTTYSSAYSHRRRLGHNVTADEELQVDMDGVMGEGGVMDSSSNSGPNPEHPNVSMTHSSPSVSVDGAVQDFEDFMNDVEDDLPEDVGDDLADSSSSANIENAQWHPYQNFTHFLLVTLYHGSHNHKISRAVVKVLLQAFKQFTGEIPTVDAVINFRNDYWHDKLLRKTEVDGDTFSYISPVGQLAMRMAHPVFSNFERMPYCPDLDNVKVREGQSSGNKWWDVARCSSLRLNGRDLFEGDSFLLEDRAVRFVQFFKHENGLYVEVQVYSASEEVDETGSSTIVFTPYVVKNEQVSKPVKMDQFLTLKSLREQNVRAELSRFKLMKNEGDSDFLRQEISVEDKICTPNVEKSVLDEGFCVVTGINLHMDDTSMNPQSKVWKSATCISLQLAGAPSGWFGWKHGDAGTMMLAVAPAKQMKPEEILQCMKPEFDILHNGFKAYDIQTKGVVSVKAAVCVFEGDLDSQRQLGPFKGSAGHAYCQRDMITVDTPVSEEENVLLRSREQLDEQMEEIESAPTRREKQELCRNYGVVPERYPPVTDMFPKFNLFDDMSCDTLHLKLLGMDKKFLVALPNHLSVEQLKKAAALLDSVMHPLLYKNRPSSKVVLSPASQIARSIKAAYQVLYIGLWLAGCEKRVCRAAFNLAELNLMLFTESDVQWDEIAMDQFDRALGRLLASMERDFPECISPKSHYLKYHIRSDIFNHGNPSSYNTQGGERKMKCEKICQTYSNKKKTNRDTTNKLISVEITRHIVTGGVISDEGEKCGKGVEQFCLSAPCREYLGLITEDIGVKLKLGDWRNKTLLKSRPQPDHVSAGCPDVSSTTWKRLTVDGVKIVRGGGVKFRQRNRCEVVGLVKQVYKNDNGVFVIVNELNPVLVVDQFLSFTESKVYDLSPSCVLVENTRSLKPHILIHGCKLEENPCQFTSSGDTVKLNCIGSEGKKFVHNRVALARFN